MGVEAELEQLPRAIGARTRHLRLARGLTLDQLAASSAVSRRMIVNVEAGSTNASIATLLRLAGALQVPLADLLGPATAAEPCTVTPQASQKELWKGDSGGRALLVAASGGFELWEWQLQANEAHSSEAHSPGTRELLHVHSGRLTLTVDGIAHALSPGDSASFAGDVPHAYACPSRGPVTFSLAVLEPT